MIPCSCVVGMRRWGSMGGGGFGDAQYLPITMPRYVPLLVQAGYISTELCALGVPLIGNGCFDATTVDAGDGRDLRGAAPRVPGSGTLGLAGIRIFAAARYLHCEDG